MKTQKCAPYDERILPFCKKEPTGRKAKYSQLEVYEAYGRCGSVVNETARQLGMDPSSVSSVVRAVQKKARTAAGILVENAYGELETKQLKILAFDIETAPHKVYCWEFYNQNISHDMVIEYGHVMSFAARWIGDDKVIYHECRDGNDKALTEALIALFDEADAVMAHNGRAFDVKAMKGRALVHTLDPPSPYKVIDTYLIAKKEFRLPRNSLEFLAEHLGCTPKSKHKKFPGFELWKACRDGNEEAWREMKKYNIQDIDTLEEVYYRLRAWSATHPNLAVCMPEPVKMCPKCTSTHILSMNPISTNAQVYDGYRCGNCGSVFRGNKTRLSPDKRAVMTQAAR